MQLRESQGLAHTCQEVICFLGLWAKDLQEGLPSPFPKGSGSTGVSAGASGQDLGDRREMVCTYPGAQFTWSLW